MLLIYKGNTALQVQYAPQAVWIQPIVGEYDNKPLLSTLARNEELLAQVYLNHQPAGDTPAQLTEYFEQRGWQVKAPGHVLPQP